MAELERWTPYGQLMVAALNPRKDLTMVDPEHTRQALASIRADNDRDLQTALVCSDVGELRGLVGAVVGRAGALAGVLELALVNNDRVEVSGG